MRAPKVLLVDDDAVVLETLAAVVEEEFSIAVASSVMEALERFDEERFAVVITDFELSDGTGETVLRRAHQELTSGILLTGHPDFGQVRDLQRQVEFLVLFKPVDPGELKTWIRHEVTMGRLRRSVRRGGR